MLNNILTKIENEISQSSYILKFADVILSKVVSNAVASAINCPCTVHCRKQIPYEHSPGCWSCLTLSSYCNPC